MAEPSAREVEQDEEEPELEGCPRCDSLVEQDDEGRCPVCGFLLDRIWADPDRRSDYERGT